MDNGMIRSRAWKLSKSNFWRLLGISFVALLPSMLLSCLQAAQGSNPSGGLLAVFTLVLLLLSPVIGFGTQRVFMQTWRTGKASLGELLYFVTAGTRFVRALLFMLSACLLGIAASTPLVLILVFLGAMFTGILGTLVMLPLTFLLSVFCIWVMLRILLSSYYFIDDQSYSVWRAITTSFKQMKGNCGRMFCMQFVVGIVAIGVMLLLAMGITFLTIAGSAAGVVILTLVFMVFGVLYAVYYNMAIAAIACELMGPTQQAPAVHNSPEL